MEIYFRLLCRQKLSAAASFYSLSVVNNPRFDGNIYKKVLLSFQTALKQQHQFISRCLDASNGIPDLCTQ